VVSVRGGGHNVSGNAVSDGGLMIRTDAPSRHFDLNGEARMAKHSHNSAIITLIYAIPSSHQFGIEFSVHTAVDDHIIV
jgi:hypothetical protein